MSRSISRRVLMAFVVVLTIAAIMLGTSSRRGPDSGSGAAKSGQDADADHGGVAREQHPFRPDSGAAIQRDASAALRTIAPNRAKTVHFDPDGNDRKDILPHPSGGSADPVVQRRSAAALSPGSASVQPAAVTTAGSFDGLGTGISGFTLGGAPPDTNSAVSPTQIVEVVNTGFAVFNKTGTILYGPANTNTLWSGFGGSCQTTNDGDAVVRWDTAAGRWIMTQFANVASTSGPYFECIAVSQTGDATGAWNRYSFQFANFPDYPKLGVWPDAYYFTYNIFSGNTFVGSEACAVNRAAMIAGTAATQQCFTTTSSYGGILPADQDGTTAPPAGEPNLVVGQGTTATTLAYWKFHVDWSNTANTTFTGPTSLTVASYTPACSGGTCIPQNGTTNQLDSLADRLMFRLAYRNFGDHEAFVVTHSVTAGSSVGVRWYELRLSGGNPTVYQQSTYAPDASYRWMSSGAQDKAGNFAIGYSVSSSSLKPGIRVAGRLAADALGTLTQGETTLVTGTGAQTGTLTRWGDYSSMSIDPSNDCTFWFSTEYLSADGTFNWRTRIASFTLPNCGATVANDFSVATSPTSGAVTAGSSATATITTAVTAGSAQAVSLSSSGLPTGATATFAPASVTAGNSSTLTIATTTATPAGVYPITVNATAASGSHTATYTLTVTAAATSGITNGGFEAGLGGWTSIGTTSVLTSGAHSGAQASRGGSTAATNGDSSLSQTFTVPAGQTALSLWYAQTCPDTVTYDWATVTLKDNTTGTTATPLAKTCKTAAWTNLATSVVAAHSYTLTLTNHDDNYAGDPTYTNWDDVTLSAPPANVIVNGGFEAGTLSGWTSAGTTSASSSGARSGTWDALVGSANATNGDSSVSQTFTPGAGLTKVTAYYSMTCPDTVAYDWATITMKDNTAGTTATLLAKTCSTTAYAAVTAALTAGHSYTLTLTSHDDNYAGDPSYTRFDDIVTT